MVQAFSNRILVVPSDPPGAMAARRRGARRDGSWTRWSPRLR